MEWLEDKTESLIWELRVQHKKDTEALAEKYRALFRNADSKGIHFNCDAIANIQKMQEKATQKLQDELDSKVHSLESALSDRR